MEASKCFSKVLKVVSFFLLLFVFMKTQGVSVQASGKSFTQTIDGVEWEVYPVVDSSEAEIQPVNANELSGDIVVPSTVDGYTITTIRSGAFDTALNITSVSIPESVKYIDEYAFYYCRKLEKVSLNSGLLAIGASAFEDCRSLKSINIPDTVNNIYDNSFTKC